MARLSAMDATGWVAAAIAASVGAVAGLDRIGARAWGGRTRGLVAGLEAARRTPRIRRYDPAELEDLPAPVARYLRAVLAPGQPVVEAARLSHRGTFNVGASRERWVAFASSQWVATNRPGFVWDARVAMLPGLSVRVHDAYVAGEGILRPALWGLVPLGEQRGTAEVARGELMRWLAEAAWYPTALLPSQGVRWEAVDDRAARVTVEDGATAASLLFVFRDDGLLDCVRAPDRGRTVGGRVVPTPWEGRWRDWRMHGGLRVPFEGEVAWLLPERRLPYWRGTVAALSCDFAA